ncbi:L-asparaginase II [Rubrobacter radiotolerans]|uniref:Asparaginase n=1 Tax=Rubrobacter radiotolerans TaxID=42256 RepID=A0A023X265_RUBRA|nr:asparaginase [Rubrobacter radiotolerans]AHY46316.1 L-asparaginase II [Rubrobacter radiotolerans]MDX5893723.1 asparaginase [Rubrobacter radiotolerans]SMC04357.1 asparaginase [Rubrobacter radiotolerans DSM 5868]
MNRAPELPSDAPLVALLRGGLIESVHRGRFAVSDPDGNLLYSAGDAEAPLFARSALKPFQALPLVLSGAADALDLSDAELAIACASHSGEEPHLRAVRSLLGKGDLSENHLANGAHPPTHPPAAEALIRTGKPPKRVHGNCSGKHAGMLVVCRHLGWRTEGYLERDHPLQEWIRALVAELCDISEKVLGFGTDGCGAPTYALPLRGLATGYARLATGKGVSPDVGRAATRLGDAMRREPYLVAGSGNLDTRVMQEARGSLVAKRGAEAVWAAGSETGRGLAIKVSDGSERAVAPVALALLGRLGQGTDIEVPPVRDLLGRAVGELVYLGADGPERDG